MNIQTLKARAFELGQNGESIDLRFEKVGIDPANPDPDEVGALIDGEEGFLPSLVSATRDAMQLCRDICIAVEEGVEINPEDFHPKTRQVVQVLASIDPGVSIPAYTDGIELLGKASIYDFASYIDAMVEMDIELMARYPFPLPMMA
jgi:hypothetical protein